MPRGRMKKEGKIDTKKKEKIIKERDRKNKRREGRER